MKGTAVVAPEEHITKTSAKKLKRRRRWRRVRGAAVQILSFIFRLFLGGWIFIQVGYKLANLLFNT